MRIRAFVKRIGRRAIWDVAAVDQSLDDYDEDKDFQEADETLPAFSKPPALELPSSQSIRYAEDAAASTRMVTCRSTLVQ